MDTFLPDMSMFSEAFRTVMRGLLSNALGRLGWEPHIVKPSLSEFVTVGRFGMELVFLSVENRFRLFFVCRK